MMRARLIGALWLALTGFAEAKVASPSRAGHGQAFTHNLEVCYSYPPTLMSYHGGPVIHGTLNVYMIYYGQWYDGTPIDVLNNLVQNIGGTEYYAINAGYSDSTGTHVANSVRLAGMRVTAGYEYGTSLGPHVVEALVRQSINYYGLPLDPNGLYVVVGDQNVTDEDDGGSFCDDNCGWHGNGAINGADIKYAFVGDPRYCWSRGKQGCGCFNLSQSPNYHPAADEMSSVLAHEMIESHTDPDGNAWYSDVDGGENADECAYTYGTTYPAGNGSIYNITLGTKKYLLQQNEFHNSATCGMSCADGGLAFCGGRCANLAHEIDNCGACGNLCPPDYSCSGGTCVPPAGCPPGTQSCCGGDFCRTTCPRDCP